MGGAKQFRPENGSSSNILNDMSGICVGELLLHAFRKGRADREAAAVKIQEIE